MYLGSINEIFSFNLLTCKNNIYLTKAIIQLTLESDEMKSKTKRSFALCDHISCERVVM